MFPGRLISLGITNATSPRSVRLRSGQALCIVGKGTETTNACICGAMPPDSEAKSSAIPRSAALAQRHQEGRNDNCFTATVPARWEWCRLSGRPTLPHKSREGWGNRPWGDAIRMGPVGPPVIPHSSENPHPPTALFGRPHPSTPAQGRLSRAKYGREMGHPTTASRGNAVVRSLGALGALLRMTRMFLL